MTEPKAHAPALERLKALRNEYGSDAGWGQQATDNLKWVAVLDPIIADLEAEGAVDWGVLHRGEKSWTTRFANGDPTWETADDATRESWALARLFWFFRMVHTGGPDGSDLDTEVYEQAQEAADWFGPRLEAAAEEAMEP